ncbi:signal recognition particle receptor beta subunit-domain-containing protein [Podospora didyma]|uniref:Signal recognition particle receptor subunit beta n=1 Tax=Podospora didyma TaxID=330526 RepID=A0AAE0K343_9PEZI|nr:signal recognition particle receptor beta subunit-domain-containing protein [Podospora didyma]
MTLLDSVKWFIEASLTPSPTVFTIGIAVVVLLPILLHFLLLAATPYATLPSVLLVGPSGAGKTALLTLFERGPLSKQEDYESSTEAEKSPSPIIDGSPASALLTHTSQTPAAVELAISDDRSSSFRDEVDTSSGSNARKFLLVDTPGHAKLRRYALSHLTGTASLKSPSTASASFPDSAPKKTKLKAVVFVVDAGALLSDSEALPSAAEYLYDVLLSLQKRMAGGKGSKAPASIPVLVAANKQDLFTAVPAALVKSNLEAELGRIRKTRSRGLLDSGVGADDDVSAREDGDDWLGEYGSEKFSFNQLMEFDIEVDVVGGNVVGDGPGADKWWKWIAERV